MFEDADTVITRKTFTGTHSGEFMGVAATSKVVHLNVIDIIRLKNGKYAEHWAVQDIAGVLAQMKS